MQMFFKFASPKAPCSFAARDALVALFTHTSDFGVEESKQETTAMAHNPEGISYLPWRSADFVFESILTFLDSERYSLHILKGLVTSSGGLTESTLKASSKCLFTYLSAMKDTPDAGLKKKQEFLEKLATILDENQKDDRVTVPLMKTVESLLTSDYL